MCDQECLQGGWWETSLDRRELVTRGTLALAAVMLAGCGGDATGPELTGSFTVRVADHPALATDGGVALVTGPGNFPVAVVRQGGSYLAVSRVCTHQGNIVNVNAGAGGYLCPGHGARFALDGTWLGGQSTTNLRRLSSSFDAASGLLTIG